MTTLVAAGGSSLNNVETLRVANANDNCNRMPSSSPRNSISSVQNERFLVVGGPTWPRGDAVASSSPARRRRARSRRYSPKRRRLVAGRDGMWWVFVAGLPADDCLETTGVDSSLRTVRPARLAARGPFIIGRHIRRRNALSSG